MSRLNTILKNIKKLLVRRLSPQTAVKLFPSLETLRTTVGDKTVFWDLMREGTKSTRNFEIVASLLEAYDLYPNLDDYRVAPVSGVDQDKTVFWLLANATKNNEARIDRLTSFLSKFKNELTFNDLEACDQTGLTFLQLLVDITYDAALKYHSWLDNDFKIQIIKLTTQFIRKFNANEINILLNTQAVLAAQGENLFLSLLLKIANQDEWEGTQDLKNAIADVIRDLDPAQFTQMMQNCCAKDRSLFSDLLADDTRQDLILNKISKFSPNQLETFFTGEAGASALITITDKVFLQFPIRKNTEAFKAADEILYRIFHEIPSGNLLQLLKKTGQSKFLGDTTIFNCIAEYLMNLVIIKGNPKLNKNIERMWDLFSDSGWSSLFEASPETFKKLIQRGLIKPSNLPEVIRKTLNKPKRACNIESRQSKPLVFSALRDKVKSRRTFSRNNKRKTNFKFN